jgi:hypothetical protein
MVTARRVCKMRGRNTGETVMTGYANQVLDAMLAFHAARQALEQNPCEPNWRAYDDAWNAWVAAEADTLLPPADTPPDEPRPAKIGTGEQRRS